MWSRYKCSDCGAEITYFTSTPDKKCISFYGKTLIKHCKGALVEMERISIDEIKRQHMRPYSHGKINATAK